MKFATFMIFTTMAIGVMTSPVQQMEQRDVDDSTAMEALFSRASSRSPSPEPTHFCLMLSLNNGKGCDTAQCKSGGGKCDLNPSTNKCNMNNMRGKQAPFACLGCGCKLEKSGH